MPKIPQVITDEYAAQHNKFQVLSASSKSIPILISILNQSIIILVTVSGSDTNEMLELQPGDLWVVIETFFSVA